MRSATIYRATNRETCEEIEGTAKELAAVGMVQKMGDLISRSALIKAITQHGKDVKCSESILNEVYQLSHKHIIDLVRIQPTAYDVEKVVEEVKELDLDGISMVEDGKYELARKKEVISLIETNGICNGRQKTCAYCYKKDCPLSTEKTLAEKWSDAVRKGGVE